MTYVKTRFSRSFSKKSPRKFTTFFPHSELPVTFSAPALALRAAKEHNTGLVRLRALHVGEVPEYARCTRRRQDMGGAAYAQAGGAAAVEFLLRKSAVRLLNPFEDA
jgi:hypothetical protein